MATVTVTPTTLDFVLYRGDTISHTLNVKDASNNTVNLTGWSAKATIKTAAGALLEDEGWTLGTPNSSGEIFMFMPNGTSDLLTTGCTYDIEIYKNQTVTELAASRLIVITVVSGTFTILNDITDGTGTGRGEIA